MRSIHTSEHFVLHSTLKNSDKKAFYNNIVGSSKILETLLHYKIIDFYYFFFVCI